MKHPKKLQMCTDALVDLYAPCTLDHFPQKVMQIMHTVVDSDINSYTEVNPAKRRAVGALDTQTMSSDEASHRMGLFLHQHPIVQHFAQTGDTTARQITDFISQSQFESLGLYTELYKLMRVRKQMAVTIASLDHGMIGAIVNRSRRDFTDTERQMLTMLGKHLAQAYRNAELMTRIEDQRLALSTAAQHAGLGVLILDSAGKVVFATDHAAKLLSRINPGTTLRLSNNLLNWFKQVLKTFTDGKKMPAQTTCTFDQGRSIMIARYAGSTRPGRHTVVLEQDPSAIGYENLLAQGLTPREAEVLQWIAQGKSNTDIAIIFGTSPRTVQKQVERILQKLNVETRIAAVARAREL